MKIAGAVLWKNIKLQGVGAKSGDGVVAIKRKTQILFQLKACAKRWRYMMRTVKVEATRITW
jgi:hypothetical protein